MEEPAADYVQSEPLTDSRLDDTHIRSWRDKGFTLVHDLLPYPLLMALKQDALAFYPAPKIKASDSHRGQRRLTRSLCTPRCSKPLPICLMYPC